ncbi:RidA family protein [Granulicella arctica]|uniref:Enamine deaminase RidA (YjgF/YER057c/UK114 family) n=1 Tax=Granulicella arctica TaxID=940613 RepID=A0A7Y9THU2_9BACT|nr:RidA family protein [Granulicella arctica]NYF80934.1 enamine deaminase RidA (YjgF/YER057c/UK114 family) [Granulicella arctica]
MSTRTNIPGTSPYEPIIGLSRAVRIGDHVHISGTGPVGADDADIVQQTEQVLSIIAIALQKAGSSFEHVYRTRIYLTRAEDWEAVARIHGRLFSTIRPAVTTLIVSGFVNPTWLVEIDADAIIPS